MKRIFPISFHCGPGGNHRGLKDYINAVTAAGYQAFLKSVDDYGHVGQFAGRDDVTRVFRLSTRGQNDGYDYDVPNYQNNATAAAIIHWDRTKAKLPADFDKSVWIEPINEIDKNRADWLGLFARQIALEALKDGYRVLMFGFSSGEPEPEFWKSKSVLGYLGLCGRHPDLLGIALHEYQYDSKKMLSDTYPYHYGRFEALLRVCDANGIKWPTVAFTESGYEYSNAPEFRRADIDYLANLYGQYPNVLGSALWCLQSYQGQPIANQMNRYMEPLADFARRWTPPPPIEQHGIDQEEKTPVKEGGGLPDKKDDIFRIYPAGYTGVDNGSHMTTNGLSPNRWTDKENVQVLTGTSVNWVEGEGYVSPEMVVIPQAGLPSWQQGPPFLNLYDEYDPAGSPLGFTQKLFARNGKLNIQVSHLDVFELPAGKHEIWLWVYPYSESDKKPAYNEDTYRVSLSFGSKRETFELQSLRDTVISMLIDGPITGRPKWELETLKSESQYENHALFVKAYGLSKIESNVIEPETGPKLPYVATVSLISQDATYDQALYLFERDFERKRTYAFSHDDAIGIVSQAMKGSLINVYGPRNGGDLAAMDAAGVEYVVHALPDLTPPETGNLNGLELGPLLDRPYVYTSLFNDGRDYSAFGGSKTDKHEGIDADVIGSNPDSDAAVLSVYGGRVTKVYRSGGYGHQVHVQSNYNGVQFVHRYAHLDDTSVNVGQIVEKGDAIGEIGTSGNVTGEHLHFNLEVPNIGLSGYVVPNVVDPQPYLPVPSKIKWPQKDKPTGKIDILDYMLGTPGAQYIMKDSSGKQERYRYEIDQNAPSLVDGFFIVKNGIYELYYVDGKYIYLIEDSSPAAADDGTDRFYRVRESETKLAPYCPRYMNAGEIWSGPTHYVQFYSKATCKSHPQNSGFAANVANLKTVSSKKTTQWGYETGDYIELVVNGERQFFEKGKGRFMWVSSWGSSERTPENVDHQTPIKRKALKC